MKLKREGKPRIEWTSNSDVIAAYDPIADVIIINKRLRKNKKILKRCLEHEMLHWKAKDSFLKHLYIDLTDNFKHLFDCEFHSEVRKLVYQNKDVMLVKMFLLNYLIVLVLSPFMILAKLWFYSYRLVELIRGGADGKA
ncbi:MAG: hypothetical protein DRN12_05300 [Thermoplasmata archaeon]|nr:MAG: hypothetical protein DRN12_05300 [Thermoplasmata archaeon]